MLRSSERRITVVLADDQRAIVDALTRLFAEQPDIELIGAGRNAEEALRLCVEHEPDVAVLDVRMPQGGGAVAAIEMRSRGLKTRVVALSAFDDKATRDHMMAAGAVSYVLKDRPVGELLEAIRQAAGRRSPGEDVAG
ncbi:MAG: response regulator transcription factor [Acidimicrobiales bacterium]